MGQNICPSPTTETNSLQNNKILNKPSSTRFSNTFPATVFKLKYIFISYTISNNEMWFGSDLSKSNLQFCV